MEQFTTYIKAIMYTDTGRWILDLRFLVEKGYLSKRLMKVERKMLVVLLLQKNIMLA